MNLAEPRVRRVTSVCLGLLVSLCLAPASGIADDAPLLPPFAAEESGRKHDWVQLESGEWLKGELTRMYDGDLYFDSDEFDDVKLDWSDVSSLVVVGPVTVRLPGRQVVTGTFEMRHGAITIVSGDRVTAAARDDVVAMTIGRQTEMRYWSGGASVGFSGRAGNATQTDLNLSADVMRQTTLTRAKLGYRGAFSSSEGVDTANSHRVPASFDVFLTERFFVTPLSFEYFADEFKNIDRRLTIGVGVGYDLFTNSFLSWEVGGGAAFQNTGYNEVTAGTSNPESDIALVFSTTIEFDLPRGIDWETNYSVQVVATDIGKTSHHLESIFSLDIWGPLDLEVAIYFDRVEKPVQSGTKVVKPNDYRATIGLGFDI